MSDARWERLQELFEHLLEMPVQQREAWLIGEEADPALRKEALALVAADVSLDGDLTLRLGDAAGDAALDPALSGTRLGPYVLRAEIGSGGMGTVFLAERVDAEFDHRVAIKLIRGIATRDASQRLRRERQILADLTHPSIARLLDGGTTEAGQPYLVMEYIEGASITEHAREQHLPRMRRLRLLQQVCRAVHYAHQRLVIHRDLKPANVLVRGDGTPVLLDFGIAKLLDAQASGPQQTQTGMPWFTPAYASPEQRSGRRVSTATDLYGLGALMFELLTDEVPAPDADGRLPPPSTRRNETGDRGGDADLDIIVAKAAHPDAERRYASAEALANDIERYLRGRPIQAAPDSLGYRLAKFVGRHRWATAASAILVVLAFALVWKLSLENERARRAEQRAQRESLTAGRVIETMIGLFDAASPEKVGLRPISAGELVDTGMQGLEGQLADEPQSKSRLVAALAEIYGKLGRNEKGIAAIGEAIALERTLDDPRALPRYLQLQGSLLNASGRYGPATLALDEGIALLERAPDADPVLLAELLTTRSLVRGRVGQMLAAIDDAERAATLAQGTDARAVVLSGEARNALSEAHLRNGDAERAIAIARANVDTLERAGAAGNASSLAREYLAAALAEHGDLAEAETLMRAQLDDRRKRLDPGSDWLITQRNQLAAIVRNLGRPLEAIELLRENVEAMRARGETTTPSYMIALNNLGSVAEQVGDHAVAEPLLREAWRLSMAEDDPTSTRPDIYRQNLARVLLLSGQYAEALPLLEQEIVDDGSAERRIDRLRRLVHLAEWYRRNGHLETASTWIAQAEANLADVFGAEHPRAGAVLRSRALIERDRGHLVAAERDLRRALAVVEGSQGAEANPVTELRLDLAGVLVRREQHDEARALVEQVRANVQTKFKLDSPTCVVFEELAAKLGVGTALQEQRRAAT
jgi:tetratricopeptide (TPR) repeat protein